MKQISDLLVKEYNWDLKDSQNIWCYGPNNCGPNILVNK